MKTHPKPISADCAVDELDRGGEPAPGLHPALVQLLALKGLPVPPAARPQTRRGLRVVLDRLLGAGAQG